MQQPHRQQPPLQQSHLLQSQIQQQQLQPQLQGQHVLQSQLQQPQLQQPLQQQPQARLLAEQRQQQLPFQQQQLRQSPEQLQQSQQADISIPAQIQGSSSKTSGSSFGTPSLPGGDQGSGVLSRAHSLRSSGTVSSGPLSRVPTRTSQHVAGPGQELASGTTSRLPSHHSQGRVATRIAVAPVPGQVSHPLQSTEPNSTGSNASGGCVLSSTSDPTHSDTASAQTSVGSGGLQLSGSGPHQLQQQNSINVQQQQQWQEPPQPGHFYVQSGQPHSGAQGLQSQVVNFANTGPVPSVVPQKPGPKKRGRKRKNPELTEDERALVRKLQNRESAKLSRVRRKVIAAEYEEQISELVDNNKRLHDQVTALNNRLSFLQSLLTVHVTPTNNSRIPSSSNGVPGPPLASEVGGHGVSVGGDGGVGVAPRPKGA